MEKFGKFIVKFRRIILIVAVLLLIPAGICYINTKVNYDLLYYLPDEIDTMKGQDIMMDEFGAGAFSMVVLENMDYEHVAELKSKIEDVEHVEKVIWYDSFLDTDIPAQLLPDSLYDAFNTEDSTLMMVIFNDSSSGEGTMKAIGDIKENCRQGMFCQWYFSYCCRYKRFGRVRNADICCIGFGNIMYSNGASYGFVSYTGAVSFKYRNGDSI